MTLHTRSCRRSLLVLVLVVAPGQVFAASPSAGPAASFADFDRKARAGERLTVVFFGASLTWGANATDPARTSYRALVADQLEARYPRAKFKCYDSAIGGPGSQLGVFRLDRDVLRHKPDLVFVDFSANDDIGGSDGETLASYEAIVRRLVLEARAPVVQVIFPFRWNIKSSELPRMKRRDAHLAIGSAYNTGVGDAIKLVIDRVEGGAVKLDDLWDVDAVHPGDAGYRLFAEAAWKAFTDALSAGRTCQAPAKMLHADTYMRSARVPLATLKPWPIGWASGRPNRTACNHDWLMSRWLDELLVARAQAGPRDKGGDQPSSAAADAGRAGLPDANASWPASPKLRVNASAVFVFGESTPQSGRFRVLLDGKAVAGNPGQVKGADLFEGNRWKSGNGYLFYELARGLDTSRHHMIEIQPVLSADPPQELRLESVCVAGGRAEVAVAKE